VSDNKEELDINRTNNRITTGLSAKLLWLTIIFIMLAEVLIFLPSVANFRNVWLKNHLEIAEAAGIVYTDTANVSLSVEASENLLQAVQAEAIAFRQDGRSMLLASADVQLDVIQHIDLDNSTVFGSIANSIAMLFMNPNSHYRVFGRSSSDNKTIELAWRIARQWFQ